MNTFGHLFRLTTFGESHGPAVGGVIDGCPAGLTIDEGFVQKELDRRRPGQSRITTPRKEFDQVEFLSGIYNGVTTGTSIGFLVRNSDQHSSDYDDLKDVFRPSHADYTYLTKYGIRDHRGGGRSSARETISRVVGGAIAKILLKQLGVEIHAYVSSVGLITLDKPYQQLDLSQVDSNIVRCPDQTTAEKMIGLIDEVREKNDSVGGTISCVATGIPAGWGEPVFNKLHAELGFAMLGINAVKGFEYGSGFAGTIMPGSLHNDSFYDDAGTIRTKTNFSGGIQGGISNGEDVYFRVAFKPIATIFQEQETVNVSHEPCNVSPKGRHDPCVLPRAVPIVESMTALVLADQYLYAKLAKL